MTKSKAETMGDAMLSGETAISLSITTPEIAEFVAKICPMVKEMDYDTELHGHFFLLGFPEPGKFAVVPPQAISDHWDHVTPYLSLQLHKLVR